MSALTWDARITDSLLQGDINRVNNRIKGMTDDIKNQGNELDSMMKKVGAGMAVYFSGDFLASFGKQIVNVRGEFQKFEAVLTNTLNGDNVKASGLLQMLSDFAAKTPFQLQDITENFVKLANQGIILTQQELVKLGDFAAVTGKPIGQLFEAIMDINNPERWKEFGTRVQTEGEKVKMSFRGQSVEFERTIAGAKDAIAQLGSMKGVEGTMNVISKTLVGQISNFQDAWDRMLNGLGKDTEGVFSGAITASTKLVENYRDVIDALKIIIATFGAAKAAAIVYNLILAEQALINAEVAASHYMFSRAQAVSFLWTERLTKAQALLNKTMLANPYVIATAAIVGLVAGLVILNKRFEESIDAKKNYDEHLKKLDEDYQSRINKGNELIGILKSESESEANRIKALKELQDLYPNIFSNLDIHKAKLKDLTTESKLLTEAETARNLQEQRAYISGLVKQRNEIESSLKNANSTNETTLDIQQRFRNRERLIQLNEQIRLAGEDEMKMMRAAADARKAEQEESEKTVQQKIKEAKSEEALGKLKEQYKQKRFTALTDTDRAKLDADIKLIDTALAKMQGKTDKGKTMSEQYSEQLDKVEERYIEFYNMLRQFGDNFDKEQFNDLLKNGKNFKEYLENQAKEYEKNIDRLKVIANKAQSSGIDLQNFVSPVKFNTIKPVIPIPSLDTKTLAEMTPKTVPASGNQIVSYLKENYEEVLGIVSQITDEIFVQMGMSEETARRFSDILNSILSGKPLETASQIIGMIIESFPKTAAEKYAEQIENINKKLREQQALIEKASRIGQEEIRRKEELELLREKLLKDQQALEKARDLKDKAIIGWGPTYEDIKKKVNELTDAVDLDKKAIEDAEQALKDFFAGGVTQNTIADIIAEGFRSGKTSVDDFAEYMNDVLLDAVIEVFKTEILGEEITKLSDYISKSLADKNLTKEEKEEIERRAKAIADSNKVVWDNLTGALNLPSTAGGDKQGLTGAVKGITEETAGIIAGQFFAMRELNQKSFMTAQEQLSGINETVAILGKIEQNTRHNVKLNDIAISVNETNRILNEKL